MRMRGLEPPRGCPHTDLNRARLPIPPHPRGATQSSVGPEDWSRRSERASGAVDRVPVLGQRRHLDDRARMRRVDEAAVADVDADVADSVEEEKVPGLEGPQADAPADAELRVRGVGKADADACVDPAREARAVEAAAGRRATPAVADPALLQRHLHDLAGADGQGCRVRPPRLDNRPEQDEEQAGEGQEAPHERWHRRRPPAPTRAGAAATPHVYGTCQGGL